jgi:hypothetical protein
MCTAHRRPRRVADVSAPTKSKGILMLMRRIVPGFAVAFAMASFLMLYPSPESDHPDLYQTYQAMRSMCSEANLVDSAFPYVYPDCRASEWVSYLFSTLGTAEWPPRAGLEFTEQEARIARIAVLPEDVAVVPLRPRRSFGKQLVIGLDDTEGLVTADAYAAWNEAPVFQREWAVPQVVASEFAAQTAESNLQMGASFATDFEAWGSELDEFGVWEDSAP